MGRTRYFAAFGILLAAILALSVVAERSQAAAQRGGSPLIEGWSLVVYEGLSLPVPAALNDATDAVDAVWAFDQDSQSWSGWSEAIPAPVRGFSVLRRGEAYFVLATEAAQWTFPQTHPFATRSEPAPVLQVGVVVEDGEHFAVVATRPANECAVAEVIAERPDVASWVLRVVQEVPAPEQLPAGACAGPGAVEELRVLLDLSIGAGALYSVGAVDGTVTPEVTTTLTIADPATEPPGAFGAGR
jgi:hypothetical protein